MCSESKTYHIKVDSGYRLTYNAPTYSYSMSNASAKSFSFFQNSIKS